jgi:O-antigen/teichoic acid export membrane protein
MKLWVYVRNGVEPFLDLIYIAVLFFVFSMTSAPIAAKGLGFLSGAVFAVYFYNRHFSIKKIWAQRPPLFIWKQILVFGFPVMIMELLSIVTLKVDLIPLSIMASASMVGVYQIILNIGNIMRNIPQSTDPILMPVVVSMRIKRDTTALENIYVTLFRLNIALSFGFFIMVAIFGDLMLLIFGEYFVIGTTACIIACFGIMVNTVFSSIEAALIMYGYPYANMMVNIFFVATNLILDFLLIPHYGLIGAALGCLIACLLTAAVQTVLIFRLLKINPFRWDFLNIIAAGLMFWVIFASVRFMFFSIGLEQYYLHAILGLVFLPFYLYFGWKYLLLPSDREKFSGLFKDKIKVL